METTGKKRTLRAYVLELLEYPRLIIQCEVDFTGCPLDGHYNAFLPKCVNCPFGRACRWLDHQRTPETKDAPLDELIEALGGAIEYLQSRDRQRDDEYDETDCFAALAKTVARWRVVTR
jgi:hypothetical protein